MADRRTAELKAEPNLTPLLDIVFQLITFFMLVINFSQENYDARIKLPVAPAARPAEAGRGAEDRLVLNITRQGNLLLSGREYAADAATREIQLQAELVKLSAKSRSDFDATNLPTTIVIRADRETDFASWNRIVQTCQAQGFRKFALKAMNSE